VIKSAGHLIGPFEVESVLVAHPAVAQAAVIGIPHPLMGDIVKAIVVVRDGHQAGDALRDDVLAFARKHLGPAVAPRGIAFVADLPRTRGGKILRPLCVRAARAAEAIPRARGADADTREALGCSARCCSFAGSRRRPPSCTAPARSAASCTSISARRRSRPG
jgi:acetyl-CoA synthetase